MDRSYINRVRRALEPNVEHIFKTRKQIEGYSKKNLIITSRIYNVLWEQFFSTSGAILYPKVFLKTVLKNAEDKRQFCVSDGLSNGEQELFLTNEHNEAIENRNSVFVYYEGKCRVKSEFLAKFTVSGDTLLPVFASELTSGEILSEKSFFTVGRTIYLKSLEKDSIKFATMLFQLQTLDIKGWDVPLEQCVGNENIREEIHFYGGGLQRSIQINRIFFLHKEARSYISVKHLKGKAQLCKCCIKNNAIMVISNDPILPDGKKNICEKCFSLLFLDKNGELRYAGTKRESLF